MYNNQYYQEDGETTPPRSPIPTSSCGLMPTHGEYAEYWSRMDYWRERDSIYDLSPSLRYSVLQTDNFSGCLPSHVGSGSDVQTSSPPSMIPDYFGNYSAVVHSSSMAGIDYSVSVDGNNGATVMPFNIQQVRPPHNWQPSSAGQGNTLDPFLLNEFTKDLPMESTEDRSVGAVCRPFQQVAYSSAGGGGRNQVSTMVYDHGHDTQQLAAPLLAGYPSAQTNQNHEGQSNHMTLPEGGDNFPTQSGSSSTIVDGASDVSSSTSEEQPSVHNSRKITCQWRTENGRCGIPIVFTQQGIVDHLEDAHGLRCKKHGVAPKNRCLWGDTDCKRTIRDGSIPRHIATSNFHQDTFIALR